MFLTRPFVGGRKISTFDPATLNLSLWQRGSYSGLPWVPAASAGTSGNRAVYAGGSGGANPAVGTSLNGFNSMRVANNKSGVSQGYPGQTADDIANVLGSLSTAYTVMGLIYIVSASAAVNNISINYENGTALQGEARWGLTVTTTGIGVYHYNGQFPWVEAPASNGAWHFFCVRFGGSLGAHNIQIDIDSTHGSVQAFNAFAALDGVPPTWGQGVFNSVTWTVDIMEMAAIKNATCTDADRDNYKDYINTRYNLSF